MTTQTSGSTQLAKYLTEGLAAARPTVPNAAPGTIVLYYATDTVHLYIWDLSTTSWKTVF